MNKFKENYIYPDIENDYLFSSRYINESLSTQEVK